VQRRRRPDVDGAGLGAEVPGAARGPAAIELRRQQRAHVADAVARVLPAARRVAVRRGQAAGDGEREAAGAVRDEGGLDEQEPAVPGEAVLAEDLVAETEEEGALLGILRDQRDAAAQALGEQEDVGPARARDLVVEEGHGRVEGAGPALHVGVAGAEGDRGEVQPFGEEDPLGGLGPRAREAADDHEAQAGEGLRGLHVDELHEGLLEGEGAARC
jgi:hypothetical protein